MSEDVEQTFPTLRYFRYQQLPEHLQAVSKPFAELAQQFARIPVNDESAPRIKAETEAGLRKLLEAKDCFVRAALP